MRGDRENIQEAIKYWTDRYEFEVIHTHVIKKTGTFSAVNEAERIVREQGFRKGSMCYDDPIALADAEQFKYIAKWQNIDRSEYSKMDGVLISHDFRDGPEVAILYFDTEFSRKVLKKIGERTA